MKKTALAAGLSLVLLSFPATGAQETVIVQSNLSFDQEAVTLHVGEKIIFRNRDQVAHNIVVVDPDEDVEDKGIQTPGEDTSESFNKPGVYKVRCNIHPDMKLTVTVK